MLTPATQDPPTRMRAVVLTSHVGGPDPRRWLGVLRHATPRWSYSTNAVTACPSNAVAHSALVCSPGPGAAVQHHHQRLCPPDCRTSPQYNLVARLRHPAFPHAYGSVIVSIPPVTRLHLPFAAPGTHESYRRFSRGRRDKECTGNDPPMRPLPIFRRVCRGLRRPSAGVPVGTASPRSVGSGARPTAEL